MLNLRRTMLAMSLMGATLTFGMSANAGHGYHLDTVKTKENVVVRAVSGGCVYTRWEDKSERCNDMVSFVHQPESTVYFAFDKHNLDNNARMTLDALVNQVRGDKDILSVRVVGHADRIGSSDYNYQLSQKRAEVVKNYLVSKNVRAKVMNVQAMGETKPVTTCSGNKVDNSLIGCLQGDRRTEIMLEVRGVKYMGEHMDYINPERTFR